MASLPRSRGIKSNNGRGTHSSASDDDLEAVPLSHTGDGFSSANNKSNYPLLNNPLINQGSTQRSSNSRNRSLLLLAVTAGGFTALCFLFSSFRSVFSPTSSSAEMLSSPSSSYGKTTEQENWPFITVQGTNFMEGCRPFFVTGINVDNLFEAAVSDVSRAAKYQGPERISGRDMVRNLLQTASKKGLNVVRTWAHTTDPSHPLQDRPGEYASDAFEALDYVIAEAEAAGVRVQLSFVDMWRYRGGIAEFIDWSTTAPKRDVDRYPPLIVEGDVTPEMMTEERQQYENIRRALFYSDPDARAMYKAHVAAILTHKNMFTGKIYREDPTIFGFGLINEPRCEVKDVPECADRLQSWIEEMAAHFRTYDTVHLLTVGEEGFYGLDDQSEIANPGAAGGSRWAAESGQDFIRNHQAAGISYAAIHAWPDNWFLNDNGEFITQWIEQHAQDAEKRLHMPLLLEEVGKKVEPAPGTPSQLKLIRDPVYKTVFRAVEHSMALFGTLQGSMLWQMEFRLYDQSPSTPYGIKFEDSTFILVDKHVARVKTYALTHPLVFDPLSPPDTGSPQNLLASASAVPVEKAAVENNNAVEKHFSMCSAEKAALQAEQSPCWVGKTVALGWIRRCSNLPAVCKQIHTAFDEAVKTTTTTPTTATPAAQLSRWDDTAGTLAAPSNVSSVGKIFGSKEECCAAESGAFATGCSSFSSVSSLF